MSAIVLVTGGAGFIGSHVVDRMAAAGHRVRILDTRPSPWHAPGAVDTVIGDVLRPADVQRAVRGCAAVCHLAAAADVSEVHAHPAWATELNGTGTLNVLEAARQAGIARVVYASTVWVYSDVEADRVDEDTLLPNPAHLYTAGKLAGELYCRAYASLYGLEPTVLRFGIPYGPRARPAAVLPRFVERARRGEPLVIAGTGDQERAFVYVEDLADGVVRALAPQAACRTYNLVGRETTTIRRLAEIVSEEVAPTPIVHTDGRAGDFRGAQVSGERAERELGWQPTTSLRDGVRRYAAWSAEDSAAASPAPVAAPAPAVAPAARSGLRRSLARLAHAAGDPVFVGAAGMIGVTSAVVAEILASRELEHAVGFMIVGVALLFPLWVLTTSAWPAEYRRLQATCAAFAASLSVVLLGLCTDGGAGDGALHAHPAVLLAITALSAGAVLATVPRRLEAAQGSSSA